ncbi:MAG: hypothetical protein ACFHWZ_09135 [Phycisphaerales bacterium]|nr:hypothetical protein [bacterium]
MKPATATTRRLWPASLLGVAIGLGSCTGVEPALIGAAVNGAQTGVSLFSGAEVWIYEIAEFEPVVEAVEQTEKELALRKLNEVREDGRYWVYYRFAKHAKLVVEVRRQTPTVTSIEVDVPDKDQQGMASLFLKRVLDRIEAQPAP